MLRVYILAGGRSSRFGSDKARAVVNDIPLVVRLQQSILRDVDSQVFVVANQVDAYQDLGVESLVDEVPHLGPVAGIATALKHFQNFPSLLENATLEKKDDRPHIAGFITSKWCLILSCDLLAWHNEWLFCLANKLARNESALNHLSSKAVCFHDEVERSKPDLHPWWNPFPGLYHADALPIASLISKSSRPSMQAFLSDPAMNTIATSSSTLPKIESANTQQELLSWLRNRSRKVTE